MIDVARCYAKLTWLNEEDVFLVHEALTYKGLNVPVGFKTDGVSSPAAVRFYVSRIGPALIPAIFHDYHYEMAFYNKEWADLLFYRMLLDFKVNKFKAKLMYLGVKWFGKGNYKNKQQRML